MMTFSLFAEEGMWPLNMVPREKILESTGVELTDSWLDHVQKSCLRVSSGGSASFVSSHGLFMTNHHVGSSAIYNLSTKERDLLSEGFYAKGCEEELKCPNLYVDQLISIEDVTDQIEGQLSEGVSAAKREKERKGVIAKIKEQAKTDTGLQPEMVTLYRGARYHLYLYKRYTDLRLVMCPEESIASFGGDIENFEFPRYALDMCFFRVYENDKPLETDHYLKWSQAGPNGNEPLFVLGHPGRTERILTANHLRFLRDYQIPFILNFLSEKIACLQKFGERSEEHSRLASNLLHSYQNSHKVYNAFNEGMKNSSLIERKSKAESLLFETLNPSQLKAWTTLDSSLKEEQTNFFAYIVLERFGGSHFSKLFTWARYLVRAAEERALPNEERLHEYQESELPALELDLFSTEPIYPELEIVLLSDSLDRVNKLLHLEENDGEEMVRASKLNDLEYRKQLYESVEELKNSTDPLILLAKALDPFARELREYVENDFNGVQKESYAQITQILFDRYGESIYPDATFTLRLSMGSMQGYVEEGEWLDPMTTIDGVFEDAEAHTGEFPYTLPTSWSDNEGVLEGSTPFNFVSTHDIIGGNSGSPVINAQGEVVGLIFDGNRHTFLWDFEFDQTVGRAISVHSAVILESLQNVYEAQALADEIAPTD